LSLQVFKISGQEIEESESLGLFARSIAALSRRPLIVHGGGREIDRLSQRLGLSPCFVGGQRVTDAKTLNAAEMVLSGTANKRLVRAFVAEGMPALGLSGCDLGLLTCRLPSLDLGLVGEPTAVNGEMLSKLLAQGILPIMSPIGLGPDFTACNVNADVAAQALAIALRARSLTFVTNVKGVMVGGIVRSRLTAAAARCAIVAGEITGGMIPKVKAALAALEGGLSEVRICDLSGLMEGGTVFSHD